MSASNDTAPPGGDQRKQLEESERQAAEPQPKSFRDEAMDDKVVEIPPVDKVDKPIQGLDP